MHYLRAPLVLLATTFVTAILAIPGVNIRQDSTLQIEEITDAFSSVSGIVQDVKDDLAKLAFASNESLTTKYIEDFSKAAHDIETLCSLGASLNTFSEAESQTLTNTTFQPFFDSVNDIVVAPSGINNLDSFDFNDFVVSLKNIASAITCLQIVVTGLVTPDAVTQLSDVYITIDSTLAHTLIGFGIFPFE